MTFFNTDNKTKKWRYILHSPKICLYNKKTKKCHRHSGMGVYNPNPKKLDSIFFAFLDSATYHYPIKAQSSAQVDISLTIRSHPGNLFQLMKDYKNFEYHIFIRAGDAPVEKPVYRTTEEIYERALRQVPTGYPDKKPDFIIKIDQVIPCKHADFCK